MICTVTFNPSLDYIVSVGDFRTGGTNRTDSERILPGGKGINVSVVLKNLGIGSRALGFTAGFTGEEIRREVEALGICPDFISVPEGLSRINVKIRNLDGTEINGMGPVIGEDRTEELMEKLDGLAAEDGSVYMAPAPEGRLVNSVGAGDSMLAGFLAGWLEKRDYGHAFRMGLAAGSASAFSECLASGEEIRALYEQVTSFRRRL